MSTLPEVVGSIFRGPGQDGDFSWMTSQPEYAHALFVFNDNEEQFEAHQKGDPMGCQPGGGNAAIRPLQCEDPPRAIGVPTGSRGQGYETLTPEVQSVLDRALTTLHSLAASGGYDKIIYSDDGQGSLGTGIFQVGEDVKSYIVNGLRGGDTALDDYMASALSPEVRFTFEHYAATVHEADWTDIQQKAKRLILDGKVTILRNTPTHIMGHVIGDGTDNNGIPDEHEVEISRQLDENGMPTSNAIEQWVCDCAWHQFAFDRRGPWAKIEGRPCSHVMAVYWKSKGTPLDTEGMGEGYQTPRGQRGPAPAPAQQQLPGVGMLPQHLQPDTDQRSFSPDEPALPTPDDEGAPPPPPLPSTQELTVPKAPESPFQNQPKQPPQREQLQLFDITAPPGGQPVPQSPVSIPGGSPPTPGNPVKFPGTFSHLIPILALRTGRFIYAADDLTEYFDSLRAAHQTIYVALTNMVALERSQGKIPIPGAQPYAVSSEGIPMYRVMELGWNPDTQSRENADVNALQGAPEQTGTYSDVNPGRYGEVLDFDPNLKMVYLSVPLRYPEGQDARLHPRALRGWVGYSDVRPVTPARSPFRPKRI